MVSNSYHNSLVSAALLSEGGGVPARSARGREKEAGERATAHPGGTGETTEEEGNVLYIHTQYYMQC